MKSPIGQNLGMGIPGLGSGFQTWHPMKGPMTTQTLQDIIGKEPHHWRGDRSGIEEFNPAFVGLLGADATLTAAEMQEFEDFLATIHFPPNPFRNFDNTLRTSLPLPGHFTTGRFAPAGQPLGNGNAQRGLALYRPPRLLDGNALSCVACHTLPTGIGADARFTNGRFVPLSIGPNGEHHHGLVSVDGHTNVTMKIPQLRNLYKKVGFETTQLANRSGFGFRHDGTVDSLARFVSGPVFTPQSDQEVADLVAFMLSFSGSDLPAGSATNVQEPPGTASKDSHAAVGKQATLAGPPSSAQADFIARATALADAGRVGLVVKGVQGGVARGYIYAGGSRFQSDRAAEVVTAEALQAAAAIASELTYTLVPKGTEPRIGIDEDEDGFFDRDERDAGTDPADPLSRPAINRAPIPVDDVVSTNENDRGHGQRPRERLGPRRRSAGRDVGHTRHDWDGDDKRRRRHHLPPELRARGRGLVHVFDLRWPWRCRDGDRARDHRSEDTSRERSRRLERQYEQQALASDGPDHRRRRSRRCGLGGDRHRGMEPGCDRLVFGGDECERCRDRSDVEPLAIDDAVGAIFGGRDRPFGAVVQRCEESGSGGGQQRDVDCRGETIARHERRLDDISATSRRRAPCASC